MRPKIFCSALYQDGSYALKYPKLTLPVTFSLVAQVAVIIHYFASLTNLLGTLHVTLPINVARRQREDISRSMLSWSSRLLILPGVTASSLFTECRAECELEARGMEAAGLLSSGPFRISTVTLSPCCSATGSFSSPSFGGTNSLGGKP